MAWEYSEKTKRIFMDAVQGKPGTHLGEIEDADGVGQHGSIVCGDALARAGCTENPPNRNDRPAFPIIRQGFVNYSLIIH